MTKKKIIKIILVLSSVVVLTQAIINYIIYIDYLNSGGKERALFGIKILTTYSYKFVIGIIPLVGFITSLFIAREKEIRTIALYCALVSFISILFSFVSIWRLFI